jgi:hypothetical protein
VLEILLAALATIPEPVEPSCCCSSSLVIWGILTSSNRLAALSRVVICDERAGPMENASTEYLAAQHKS